MDWVDLPEYRNRWLAAVNTTSTIRLDKMSAISWLAEKVPASQEGLCSVNLCRSRLAKGFNTLNFEEFTSLKLIRCNTHHSVLVILDSHLTLVMGIGNILWNKTVYDYDQSIAHFGSFVVWTWSVVTFMMMMAMIMMVMVIIIIIIIKFFIF